MKSDPTQLANRLGRINAVLAVMLGFGLTLYAVDRSRHELESPVHLVSGIPAAIAGDIILGTLTSSGAEVTNATTGVPFCIPPIQKVSVQCDADSFILTDTTATVTSSNGVRYPKNALVGTSLNTDWSSASRVTVAGTSCGVMRMISASGTSNCKVFRVYGDEPAGRGL